MYLLLGAIGFLFFVTCFIWGLVRLAVPFCGRSRKGGLLYLELSLLGWLPFLHFAPPLHPTLQSVSGTYTSNSDGGHYVYHLYPNGTLAQTFEADGHMAYRKQGKWKVSDRQILFDHLSIEYGSLYLLSSSIGIDDEAGIYLEKVEKRIWEILFPFVFWPLLGFYLTTLVRRFRASRRIPQRVS